MVAGADAASAASMSRTCCPKSLAAAGASPHVAVKAKRGEGVGAVGRGEGIAVWAVALLVGPD